jgi:hypothetical protein
MIGVAARLLGCLVNLVYAIGIGQISRALQRRRPAAP